MIPKDIDQITEDDLQSLIVNSVLERKTIEYKEQLPGNSDSEKIGFLSGVSSFANASGGDIVFGIAENRETGIPREIVGLNTKNVDQEIARLDGMLRDGIEPRIPTISIRPITVSISKIVIIIRISKSWVSPHRVILKGHDKFYARGVNGKYPLDVAELRIAFNASDAIAERIKKFREDRISKIFAAETPVPFTGTAKMVLHLIPLNSFNPARSYSIEDSSKLSLDLRPMNCHGWSHRYNLDGFLTYAPGSDGKSYSYVQFFRNGILEAVESLVLGYSHEEKLIPSVSYEEELISALQGFLAFFKKLNVDLPIVLFLTLIGVEGYELAIDRIRFWPMKSEKIERDILLLPEALIESYDVKTPAILRPIFDSVWNSCGFAKSFNYDSSGEWRRS